MTPEDIESQIVHDVAILDSNGAPVEGTEFSFTGTYNKDEIVLKVNRYAVIESMQVTDVHGTRLAQVDNLPKVADKGDVITIAPHALVSLYEPPGPTSVTLYYPDLQVLRAALSKMEALLNEDPSFLLSQHSELVEFYELVSRLS